MSKAKIKKEEKVYNFQVSVDYKEYKFLFFNVKAIGKALPAVNVLRINQ